MKKQIHHYLITIYNSINTFFLFEIEKNNKIYIINSYPRCGTFIVAHPPTSDALTCGFFVI